MTEPAKWKQVLTSRKFWALLTALLAVIGKTWWPDLPLQEDQVAAMVAALAAYMLGVALEDGLRAR